LHKKQVGESVRDLGLEGQKEKEGTPTMGGILILAAILIPTLLFARLDNVYVLTMLISTVWLGAIGFIDDYIKVFKKNKKGLAGKFKIIGQVGIGILVGCVMYFHEDVVIKIEDDVQHVQVTQDDAFKGNHVFGPQHDHITEKSLKTTVPLLTNNEFDYYWLLGKGNEKSAWLLFIPLVIIRVNGVSNKAKMKAELNGLAAAISAIIKIARATLAYVSGNVNLADYLNVMYIAESAVLVVFISAYFGACLG